MPTFTISRPTAYTVEFPTSELTFASDGAPADTGELTAIRMELAAAGVTDLLVLCGGWADKESELRSLYDGFATVTRSAVRRDPALAAHTYGVLRIVWPARRWIEPQLNLRLNTLGAEERAHRNVAALEMEVTSLRGTFTAHQADRHLLKVWQLIGSVSESIPARVSLVEHLRELVRGTDANNPSRKHNEYASRRFLAMHPILLLEAVSPQIGSEHAQHVPQSGEGFESDANFAATSPDPCDVYQGIRNLLRYALASEMRARAEAVGRLGLRESLLTLSRGLPQTRFHLIGHSFGARAVLTAVDASADSNKLLCPKSVSLLQPALPEDAFAPAGEGSDEGIFHSVLAEGKVAGPILVSYTMNDETARVPYDIARDIATHSQPGKFDYREPPRAMAQHGAAQTGAHQVSIASHVMPRWHRGMVVNLNGYGVIASHSDVCKLEIAQSILSAATTTT
jgi:hypothetical protein